MLHANLLTVDPPAGLRWCSPRELRLFVGLFQLKLFGKLHRDFLGLDVVSLEDKRAEEVNLEQTEEEPKTSDR